MQENYSFYFDETFHDRKIRLNECGEINILRSDTLDNYIGVFWGCRQKETEANKSLLSRFEEKYRSFYKLSDSQELKSTIISKKNFKHGVGSFNTETLNFYRDFFATMEAINPIIQIDMISKMELYLRNIFEKVKFEYPLMMNNNAFFYSLTKFFIYYHSRDLLKEMWMAQDSSGIQTFVDKLVDALEKVSIIGMKIPRKELESKVFTEIAFFIETAEYTSPISSERDFCYETVFEGLNRLLEEKHINKNAVYVFLDKENKTFAAGQNMGYVMLVQLDSKESIEIRACDWLAGFVGRLIHAMMLDENMKEDLVQSYDDFSLCDLERKRMLSKEWFILTSEQFEFYHLVFRVMIENQNCHWATMTLSYGDQCAVFYTLLRYFDRYNTYEDYQNVSLLEHVERFNSDCCNELKRHYQSF